MAQHVQEEAEAEGEESQEQGRQVAAAEHQPALRQRQAEESHPVAKGSAEADVQRHFQILSKCLISPARDLCTSRAMRGLSHGSECV